MEKQKNAVAWDPARYLKFKRQRTQPSIDLAARIPLAEPGRVVDIGCGPGNSTEVLGQRFPGADILGVDSSAEMIEEARRNRPQFRFEIADVSGPLDALGGGYDVVFSNACIQWIPGHKTLLPRLVGLLGPGGVLAVQTPLADKQQMYALIQQLAQEEPWKALFLQAPPAQHIMNNLAPEAYIDLLEGLGLEVELWETVYYHMMPSAADVLEWYRGTGLRPYLAALPTARRGEFEVELLARVEAAFAHQASGELVLKFPRLFFTARRP